MSLIVSVNFSSAHTGTVNYRAASSIHFSTSIMVRVCVPWRREPYLGRSIRAYFSRQKFTFRPQIALKPTPQ